MIRKKLAAETSTRSAAAIKNSPDRSRPMEELLTTSEVAVLLHVSVKTLRRRIVDGYLPTVRDGRIVRIRQSDLRQYINDRWNG
jgi:excisionase family DNA binding protein